MESKIINWLLEDEDPSLKYRVLTELLDNNELSDEVRETKSMINDSIAVTSIFSKMHPDGYWIQKNPRTKEVLGDDVEYGSFATTHFCLSYLSELALTKDDPRVYKASERYLNLSNDDGDWWLHLSCLYSFNIRTFMKLGYKNDARLNKAIDLMLESFRFDGGYLCDLHEKKRKNKKSCIRGSSKALMAFAEMPEFRDHESCTSLVEYFLNRNGIFKSKNKEKFVNKDVMRNAFPFTWRTNSWEILYALSKLGYGNDKRLINAWESIEYHRTADNKYKLHYTPAQAPWKAGNKNEPNKWVTFYILLAKKYRKQYA